LCGSSSEWATGIERLWKYHRAHLRRVVREIPEAEHAIPIEAYLDHARALVATTPGVRSSSYTAKLNLRRFVRARLEKSKA
jgi:hypothetical protein